MRWPRMRNPWRSAEGAPASPTAATSKGRWDVPITAIIALLRARWRLCCMAWPPATASWQQAHRVAGHASVDRGQRIRTAADGRRPDRRHRGCRGRRLHVAGRACHLVQKTDHSPGLSKKLPAVRPPGVSLFLDKRSFRPSRAARRNVRACGAPIRGRRTSVRHARARPSRRAR